jgi:endonuclease/exonuclease/phosphatase (EEP) superfamily protein YafD
MKNKWSKGLFTRLVIYMTLVTLAGFLGRLFWVLDLFSHFRVQIFQCCLVLIGFALWRRKNKQAALLALLACLNYAFILPFYIGKPASSGGPTVRAMLLNLNAANGNTGTVLAAIKAANPDILLLEEVTPAWAQVFDGLDYPYRVAEVREDFFGIMLLSRMPLSNTNVVQIGDAGVPSILATAHLPQGELAVIGTHPLPPSGAAYSRHRDNQLAALAPMVREQKNPVLLIGDLNASPWSAHFTRLLRETGLKNSMKGFGFQPSWPANIRLLQIPIDQILHSPEIAIRRRTVGTDVGSDHLPVIADFYFK